MSADPNESGDFDDFFQSGESGIYEGGPAKLKPEPPPPATEIEDWGARPLSPETLARQARLRRLVVAIVVPLGLASAALFATRWLRAPAPEQASLGVAVGAARTVALAESPSATVVASAEVEAPKPVVSSVEAPKPVIASEEAPKPVVSSEEAPKPVFSSAPVVASAEVPKPVVSASAPKPAVSAETTAAKPVQKRARSVALVPKEVPKPAPEVPRRRSAEVLPTAAFPIETH